MPRACVAHTCVLTTTSPGALGAARGAPGRPMRRSGAALRSQPGAVAVCAARPEALSLLGMLMRLATALLLLVSGIVPTGTSLCVSSACSLELESSHAPCCGPRDADARPIDDARADPGEEPCSECSDIVFSDDAMASVAAPSAPPAPVAACLAGPPACAPPPQGPREAAPTVSSEDIPLSRLATLRTIVIRC